MSTTTRPRLAGYAAAATLARLADEMVALTVVLLVLQRTGSATLAGLVVAGYTLPAVVTGPLLGAWLGHAHRPKLALAANELLLAAVLAALTLLAGHAPGAVLMALTAAAGASLPMTSGGFSSLVPRLAASDALARANTVDAVTFNLAAMGGPALGGLLAATLGPPVATLAAAAFALLAVPATAAITLTRPATIPSGTTSPTPDRRPVLRTARQGLRHLARTPPLRGTTLASVLSYGCFGLLVVALPTRTAELGAGRSAAGYLWSGFEVGGALAVLLIGPRLRRFRPERVAVGVIAAFGLVVGCWPLAGTFAALLGLVVLAGLAEGPLLPTVFAVRQRYTPPPLLAQVSTTGASLKIGAYAAGSALSGALEPHTGPVPLILTAAAGQLLAATLGLLTARPAALNRLPAGQ